MLPTAPEDRRTAYTEAAVEKLLHVADAGLRAAAILELRWSDVDIAGATIRVRAKGQKKRTAGHTEDALQALQDWRPSSSNGSGTLRPQPTDYASGGTYVNLYWLEKVLTPESEQERAAAWMV